MQAAAPHYFHSRAQGNAVAHGYVHRLSVLSILQDGNGNDISVSILQFHFCQPPLSHQVLDFSVLRTSWQQGVAKSRVSKPVGSAIRQMCGSLLCKTTFQTLLPSPMVSLFNRSTGASSMQTWLAVFVYCSSVRPLPSSRQFHADGLHLPRPIRWPAALMISCWASHP